MLAGLVLLKEVAIKCCHREFRYVQCAQCLLSLLCCLVIHNLILKLEAYQLIPFDIGDKIIGLSWLH